MPIFPQDGMAILSSAHKDTIGIESQPNRCVILSNETPETGNAARIE
jgi:hypothetical protein